MPACKQQILFYSARLPGYSQMRGGSFYKQEAMTENDKAQILAAYERASNLGTIARARLVQVVAQATGFDEPEVLAVVEGEA